MANFKFFRILLITALFLAAAPVNSRSGNYEIFIVNSTKKKTPLNIEIAETQAERERGLMFRTRLPENSGMLFVFDMERHLSFWMKNTYIPLDIAYISSKGVINEIHTMKPLDYTVTYPSSKPAKYALEVNAGWFKKNRIKPGMKLDFNGCLGK